MGGWSLTCVRRRRRRQQQQYTKPDRAHCLIKSQKARIQPPISTIMLNSAGASTETLCTYGFMIIHYNLDLVANLYIFRQFAL